MRTFALRNGDLVLTGDRYGMVEGAALLQQQLSLALTEPFGSDRFHPRWGSVLNQWIGGTISDETISFVQAEVLRVVKNYVVAQNAALTQRTSGMKRPNVSLNEIISEVTDVTVRPSGDSLVVRVGLRTAARQEFAVMATTQRSA